MGRAFEHHGLPRLRDTDRLTPRPSADSVLVMRSITRIPRPVRVYLCIWFVCALTATGVVRLMSIVDRDLGNRLHSHGASVSATVTKLEPNNHNSVEYRFSVDGTTYSDGWFGDGFEGTAGELVVGQSIHVFYDKTDPDYSCYCDPGFLYEEGQLWRNALAGAFVSTIGAAALTAVYLRRRTRRVNGAAKPSS